MVRAFVMRKGAFSDKKDSKLIKMDEKVKQCLRRHLGEGGARNGESPSEGIVDIIDLGEGSTPLFFIIVM